MMVSELLDGENVFVDANIYLFNALDDPRYGEASTQFLEMIERGELNAVTNVLVVNEVASKILMAELSNYSEKFNIRRAKKLLKSKEMAENEYKPVKEYLAYLKGLECLEIIEITSRVAFSLVVLGQRYGLLPADSFHLATMKEFGMTFIVTDDADFKGVDLVEVVALGVL